MSNLFFLQLKKQTTPQSFSSADYQVFHTAPNGKPGTFEYGHHNFVNPLPCSALFSCGRNIQKVDFYPAKGYIVLKGKNRTMKIPN